MPNFNLDGTALEMPEVTGTPIPEASPLRGVESPQQRGFSLDGTIPGTITDAQKIGLALEQPDQTPERAARVLKMEKVTRLPLPVISENLEDVEREAAKADFDLDQFTRDNPKVSAWLAANSEHAALAKDDMKNLGTLEWMFSAPVRAFERGQERTKFRDIRYRHLMGSPMSADEMKQLGELKRKTETGSDFGAETWFGEALVGGAEFLPQLGSQYGRGAMYAAPALGAAALGSVIFPPAAPALFKAGTASAGALFTAGVIEEGFKMEAAEAFDEFLGFRDEQGKPLDENVARIAAVTAGAMNSGLEALQARILLKAIPGADKLVGPLARSAVREALKSPTVLSALGGMAATYGKTLGAETLTEVVQRAITIMSGEFAKMASDENFAYRGVGDIAADLASEARGAALSFAYVVAPGPVARGVIDVRAARQAQQQEQFFTALGENATQSKTRERLPEKYQELIEQMTKNGPVENLYVPVEFYQTHWESQNLDPRAVAVEMGIEKQYDEAVTTGAKLEIPTAIYARRIAPTESNTAFAKELSTGPELMNAREADEFLKQAKEPTEEVMDSVAESAIKVREDIRGQLIGVVPNDVAERYATLYESTFKSLGQRSGIDPYQLYQRYGLKVSRELPDVLKKLPKLENLDVLLDRLRAGETVTMEQARGKSLLQFLKPFGLQDEGGELAARDLGKSVKGLVKPAGLSLDGAAEKAFEAGYLTAYDQNELLKAIDEELSGTPRYAQGQGDTQAQETMTALNELEKFLGQLGIDIKTMDNVALKRLITEGAKAGEGLVLAQGAKPQLSVLHNLSSENLEFSDKMGGIAVPSLAIVKEGMGLEGYGDITLIGRRELADPKQTEVYDADAYTSTFPRPEYRKVKSAVAQKFVDALRPWTNLFGESGVFQRAWDNAVNTPRPADTILSFTRSNAVKAWFLDEKGVEVKPTMERVERAFRWASDPEFKQTLAALSDDLEASKDYENNPAHMKLADAARAAIDRYMATHPKEVKSWHEVYPDATDAEIRDNYGMMFGISGEWVSKGEPIPFGLYDKIRDDLRKEGRTQVNRQATDKKINKAMHGYEAEFKQWVDDKVLPIYGEPFLTLGRKKVEYSLENIVEYMTRDGLKATEETMTFGEGKARAVAATRIKSFDEMRNRAEGQITEREEVDEIRKEAKKAMEE